MKSLSRHRSRLLWSGAGIAAVAALAIGLAGCTNKTTDPQSPETSAPTQTETPASGESQSPSPSASSSPTPSATEDAPDPTDEQWSISAQSSEPANAGETQVITDFRMGSHDGYDRVVLELSGSGTPGWNTDWVDHAVEQGRGKDIDLTGPTFLDVRVTGVSDPIGEELAAIAYTTSGGKESGDIRAYYDSSFEGQAHLVIGMDQQRPYKVFALGNPSRVVIDVQKP